MLENAMQADRIVYSLATELDGALSFVGAFDEAILSEELRDLKRRVSADWLPRHNPLLRMPQFANAVRSGRLAVQFLVEPFNMSDALIVSEDTLITSFAEPGAIYANLRRSTVDIAARVQALADPTRLMILRMIRYLSMNNTDIAEFLELARPTVSIHAKVLREAGLIETYSEGRQVRHTIKPGAVRRLFADLEKFLDLPDQ
jgi:DNA-binding transcriptional ArsR family regulator